MQKVKIGTRVEALGIQKVNVADGTKARVALIDPDPQVKYIAYDPNVKRRVEVTQDLLIKYNLKATPTFFYLIARLNTDMKGNVADSDFTVEYLQLTNNVNTEFADAVAENPNFSSIVLSKVSKKGDGGKDYSYVKATPSNYVVSDEIQQKINILRQNPEAIASMWQLIDRATSITAAEYEELLRSPMVKASEDEVNDITPSMIDAPQKAAPLISAGESFPQKVVEQNPFDVDDAGNDFNTGSDEDFNW